MRHAKAATAHLIREEHLSASGKLPALVLRRAAPVKAGITRKPAASSA
jgi:hypothetical protein